MRRMSYHTMTFAIVLLLVGGGASGLALASPTINDVIFDLRVFNDCPFSTVTTSNTYPVEVWIEDSDLLNSCPNANFANLHDWTLSSDGGATQAVFSNSNNFKLGAWLTISGPANGEAGLRVSPWWSKLVDGNFNVRVPDGEIACFGGRLPFYSFTANHGINYVKGDAIYLEVIYVSNSNTMANPATIQYNVTYNAVNYTSGALPFDEGNPLEDPPYGLWGMLNDARVGGYLKAFVANPAGDAVKATWRDINYMDLTPVPTVESSWGKLKSTYR